MIKLTPGMVSNVSAAQNGSMADEVIVKRPIAVSDNLGGQIRSIITVGRSTCRISSNTTAQEREIAERLQIAFPVIVTFPLFSDVVEGDHLLHEASGKELVIAFVPLASAITTALRAICKGAK